MCQFCPLWWTFHSAISEPCVQADAYSIVLPICLKILLLSLCTIRKSSPSLYSSMTSAIPLPNPQSPIGLDGGSDPAPIKPSSLLFVQFPPPPAPHGELVLNGVDAVADGGENDKEDDDDDGDDNVTLDHDGGCLDQAVRRNLGAEKR